MVERQLGNYRILQRIGEGGMGTVYRAVDVMLEREVALKILRPDLAGQPEVEARFRDEAVTLARLNHPNIAMLYALGREGDEFFMVMEYVKGASLEAVLARSGPIDPATAILWCCQVLDAMEYAHRKGIVHRDLKPANLVLSETGVIKVTDFGIARVLGGQRRTRDGRIIGTIAYMSPEQVHGQDVDGRTDIYSLATVLYELITGRLPFQAADEFDLMCAKVKDKPLPPTTVCPGVHEWLSAVIMKALATAPSDRYETAAAFRDALQHGLGSLDMTVVSAAAAAFAARATEAAAAREVKPTRLAAPLDPDLELPPHAEPNHMSFIDAILKILGR